MILHYVTALIYATRVMLYFCRRLATLRRRRHVIDCLLSPSAACRRLCAERSVYALHAEDIMLPLMALTTGAMRRWRALLMRREARRCYAAPAACFAIPRAEQRYVDATIIADESAQEAEALLLLMFADVFRYAR